MSIRSLTQEDPIGLAGGLNLYGFAAGDPVNFSDPFGLCPPKWLCDLIGASAGESSLEYYAQVATDPSSSGVEKFGATVGGLFAALWTPDTYLQTATTLTGAAGASRALAGRAGGAFEAAAGGGRHSGLLRNYAGRSPGEIGRAVRSLESRAAQHLDKIANPARHAENWANLSAREQAGLLRKWQQDAARLAEQADVLRGLLR